MPDARAATLGYYLTDRAAVVLGGLVKKPVLAVLGLFLVFTLCFAAGCAAGPNVFKNSPGANGSVAGFWLGLWHGFILPFAFVVSLFSDKVTVYEVHNAGAWYNFGFLLGAAMIWGEAEPPLDDANPPQGAPVLAI
jgi:hypothetical protein